MIAQAQRQQGSSPSRRPMYNPPATAGPMNSSFPVGGERRASQTAQYINGMDGVPMTAALGGKFGGRAQFGDDDADKSSLPSRVISGGTSLGGMTPSSTGTTVLNQAASKADGASSWRRGSLNPNNSVTAALNAARASSPSVRVTPPPSERNSPPPAAPAPAKARPQALQFNQAATSPSLPVVAVVDTDADDDTSSTGSDKSGPSTPTSADSMRPPLSPREEASKKLYEGLGIGRPVPSTPTLAVAPATSAAVQRILSQAVRMPRGPPSGADELGPKNFATRIRRKAIGGLGMLMDARERREVEAF